ARLRRRRARSVGSTRQRNRRPPCHRDRHKACDSGWNQTSKQTRARLLHPIARLRPKSLNTAFQTLIHVSEAMVASSSTKSIDLDQEILKAPAYAVFSQWSRWRRKQKIRRAAIDHLEVFSVCANAQWSERIFKARQAWAATSCLKSSKRHHAPARPALHRLATIGVGRMTTVGGTRAHRQLQPHTFLEEPFSGQQRR